MKNANALGSVAGIKTRPHFDGSSYEDEGDQPTKQYLKTKAGLLGEERKLNSRQRARDQEKQKVRRRRVKGEKCETKAMREKEEAVKEIIAGNDPISETGHVEETDSESPVLSENDSNEKHSEHPSQKRDHGSKSSLLSADYS